MKQVNAKVISNEKLWGEFRQHGRLKYLSSWLMWINCPEISPEAQPGQFIMVNCGKDCMVPRPFSIHQVSAEGSIAIFYAVLEKGKGTKWLSERRVGDTINIFGPCGNGFAIDTSSKNILLVAGGNGVAPLCFLAQNSLNNKLSVIMLYGTADNKRLSFASELNVLSSTEDGSVGHKGKVNELIPDYVDWANQIFASGPIGLYRAMARIPELKDKPVQVSLEIMMGCGVGACYGCAIRTKHGMKKVCQDGPVFELGEVEWGSVSIAP